MSFGVARIHEKASKRGLPIGNVGLQSSLQSNWLRLASGIFAALISIYWLDEVLLRFFTSGGLPGDVQRTIMLCEAFSHGSGVGLILLVLLSVDKANRRRLLVVATCAFGSGMSANAMKLMVHRLRPSAMLEQGLNAVASFQGIGFSTVDQLLADQAHTLQSFPSAHTSTAFGFAVGLVWCYQKGHVAFFVLAMMAGIQRIVVGAHWPSDVVAGATLGLVVAPAIISLSIRFQRQLRKGVSLEVDNLAAGTSQ